MIDLGANSAYVPFGHFRNRIEVFDIIPGTRQLTIPEGWTKIRVAVVGGGGSGRNKSSTFHGYGGGGGGGGYAEIELDVVAGQTYTYTVGAGGNLNQDGGTTSFGGMLSATGGRTATDNTTVASIGGEGGVGIGGSINTSGGTGGNGFDAKDGGGGGGGASGHRYGDGGAGGAGEAPAGDSTYPKIMGGVGGSWADTPRPLLYDDGWGLGITPYDLPLDAELFAYYAASSRFNRVGEGSSDSSTMVNIGGGACARRVNNPTDVRRGGIGGGGGGGYSTTYTGCGGPGAVIVEVLS